MVWYNSFVKINVYIYDDIRFKTCTHTQLESLYLYLQNKKCISFDLWAMAPEISPKR